MIGELNQRAVLLARVMTPDGGGGYGESWNTAANLWVKLEALGAGAPVGPGAAESRTRCRITLWRNADVAEGMRIGIGARTFAIRTILDEGGAAQTMVLLCEELP